MTDRPMQWMKAGGVFDRIDGMNGIGRRTPPKRLCPPRRRWPSCSSRQKMFTPSTPRPGGPTHFSPARQGREPVRSIGQAPEGRHMDVAVVSITQAKAPEGNVWVQQNIMVLRVPRARREMPS
jgi:hypothetical protein